MTFWLRQSCCLYAFGMVAGILGVRWRKPLTVRSVWMSVAWDTSQGCNAKKYWPPIQKKIQTLLKYLNLSILKQKHWEWQVVFENFTLSLTLYFFSQFPDCWLFYFIILMAW